MSAAQALSKRNDLHIARKLWHILTGLTGLGAYFAINYPAQTVGLGLLIFGVVGLLFDLLRIKFDKINKIVLTVLGPFMRESERNSVSGLPFYALGVGGSLLFYNENFAIISVLFLIFADPISSAFGIVFGKQKIYGNKSFEGTAAGFICCFTIVMSYGLMYFPININLFAFSLLAALAGSFAELIGTKIDDNLTIPLISGGVMSVVNLIIPMV